VTGPTVSVRPLGNGCHQVDILHGFMEPSDVPAGLDGIQVDGRVVRASEVTYFLGRETVIATPVHTMAMWRERLFSAQLRSASSAARFFDLPAEQVVEVGSQVEI
jgi:KUP system potassium uptake protein